MPSRGVSQNAERGLRQCAPASLLVFFRCERFWCGTLRLGQIHIRVYEEQENAGLHMPLVPGGRFGRGGLGAEPRRHAREKPFKRGAMLEEFYLKYGTPEDLRRAGITPGT